MNSTLRQLSYLVEAARSGSVSAAAKNLSISSSSILMAIDKIESEFGVQIFVRQRSKGLMITTAGKTVILRIVQLLDEVDSFEKDLGGHEYSIEGEIHVGCFGSISPHILPQIIRNLTADHPGIKAHMHEGNLLRIQEYLRNGTVDILVTYDAGMTDEFDIEPLVSAPPHAVLAANEELALQDQVSLKDLAQRPLFLMDLPESANYILSVFKDHGYRPNVVHRTESYEMIRSSVAAGLGVAIQNMRPLINVTYGGLEVVCKPILESTRDTLLVIANRSHSESNRLANVFKKYLSDFLQ
jgi:DNA-binding transcriptional LysR family regulator